jgi:HD-GYP domain-containing protein (c-di-GMP phosphodiesterase class II)
LSAATPGEQRTATCRICGEPVAAPPFARSGEAYCCEACYLRAHEAEHGDAIRAEAALAEALASALDLREHETGLHSKRVACHTLELARRSVPEASERLRQIYWGALLHDIGKIGISDAVLLKDGPLTDSEWQEMRAHPEMGYRIVAQVPGMQEAADIVRCHEERFDGSGYPRGLSEEAIPWGARLFAVIDTLDAITSDRPYRQALPFDAAKTEILRMSDSQFDPRAVRVFLEAEPMLRAMVSLKCGTASADDIFLQAMKGE